MLSARSTSGPLWTKSTTPEKGLTGSLKELVGIEESADTTADFICVDDINESNGAEVDDDASADHLAVAQLSIKVVLAFA